MDFIEKAKKAIGRESKEAILRAIGYALISIAESLKKLSIRSFR